MVKTKPVNPKSLGPAIGYAHGTHHESGMVLVAGQVGGDHVGEGKWKIDKGIAAQFGKAVANVVAVVREAGGKPEDIAEMTIFIKDMRAYRASRKEIGAAWRKVMGKHYPAMTLVEVSDLFEDGALVEIKAVAFLR